MEPVDDVIPVFLNNSDGELIMQIEDHPRVIVFNEVQP